MKAKLKNDGERMIPEFHKNNLLYAEHVSRYSVAQSLCKDKVVLDIASGSGYGTNLLAATAKKVYGVEIDKESVQYAQENFGSGNIEFKQGSATDIPLADASVDVVVTFETIEHIEDYEKFMAEIKRILKPGGLALISTPNDVEFAEGNHFHLHEFQYKEFQKLTGTYFKFTKEYFQATWKAAMIGDFELLGKDGLREMPVYNQASLPVDKFLYFYFICSDKPIKQTIEPVVALGAHYSDRTLLAEADHHRMVMDERNNVIKDKERELQNVHTHTDQLQAEIDSLRLKLANSERALTEIYASKAYKIARKVQSVGHKAEK